MNLLIRFIKRNNDSVTYQQRISEHGKRQAWQRHMGINRPTWWRARAKLLPRRPNRLAGWDEHLR